MSEKTPTTELAKPAAKMSIKQILNSDAMKAQFNAALPEHLSADRFCRIAITALSKTPKLLQCSQESLFRCLLDLSAMGLEPDGRKAHLIPRGTECTLLVDYKGLVDLVRRDPSVVDVQCFPIRENDHCQVTNGTIEHSYSPLADRGEIVAVYTKLTLKDGYVSYGEPMTRAEAEKVRSISPAKNSGPWVDHFDEMWKKTAVRRSSKLWPLSPETEHHISKSDEEFEFHRAKPMRQSSPTPGPRLAAPEIDVESEVSEPPKKAVAKAKEKPKAEPEPESKGEPERFKNEIIENLRDNLMASEEITDAELTAHMVKEGFTIAKGQGWGSLPKATLEKVEDGWDAIEAAIKGGRKA